MAGASNKGPNDPHGGAPIEVPEIEGESRAPGANRVEIGGRSFTVRETPANDEAGKAAGGRDAPSGARRRIRVYGTSSWPTKASELMKDVRAAEKRRAITVKGRKVTVKDREHFKQIGYAMDDKKRRQMKEHMALSRADRFRKMVRFFDEE